MKKIILSCLVFVFVNTMASDITRGPVLQKLTTSSVVIVWEGSATLTGTIDYGETAAYGNSINVTPTTYTDSSNPTPVMRTVYKGEITGLLSATTYYYRATCGSSVITGNFMTAIMPGNNFNFVAMGDHHGGRWGEGSTGLSSHMALIRNENPLFMINTGDFIQENRDELWDSLFFSQAPVMETLKKIPLFTVSGNHECTGYVSVYSKTFQNFFVPPVNNYSGDGGKMYYSFDIGDVHFVGIGWQYGDEDNNTALYFDSRLKAWLENDLASTTKNFKIVFRHKPIYCSAYANRWNDKYSNGDEYMENLMEKYGVNFYLCGHAHFYQQSFPLHSGVRYQNGTTHIVMVGPGGGTGMV